MAYDEFLEERISQVLTNKNIVFETKKMMGGLCYMVNQKMCVGIVGNQLMARIGPIAYEAALQQPFVKEMNFTGKALKGYVFVLPEGVDTSNDLEAWIELCLDFNLFAKSAKK